MQEFQLTSLIQLTSTPNPKELHRDAHFERKHGTKMKSTFKHLLHTTINVSRRGTRGTRIRSSKT
jgi:hypothetical protein